MKRHLLLFFLPLALLLGALLFLWGTPAPTVEERDSNYVRRLPQPPPRLPPDAALLDALPDALIDAAPRFEPLPEEAALKLEEIQALGLVNRDPKWIKTRLPKGWEMKEQREGENVLYSVQEEGDGQVQWIIKSGRIWGAKIDAPKEPGRSADLSLLARAILGNAHSSMELRCTGSPQTQAAYLGRVKMKSGYLHFRCTPKQTPPYEALKLEVQIEPFEAHVGER